MLVGVYVHTETYTRMFTAALFINAQNLETTTLSWVNGHINLGTSDNGIFSRAEKNEHSNHGKTCAVKVKDAQSCPTLCGPWTIQFMEFSRPEYWSGSPFPSPGDLSNLGIEPWSPALQAGSLSDEPPGKPKATLNVYY